MLEQENFKRFRRSYQDRQNSRIDIRNIPKPHTTPGDPMSYVQTLHKLREELIHQENTNLLNSLERFRTQQFSGHGLQIQSKTGVRKRGTIIDRAKKNGVDKRNIKNLNKIEKKSNTVGRTKELADDPWGLEFPRLPTKTMLSLNSDIRNIISQQKARIAGFNLQQTITPTSSIPNPDRKSLRHPGKLLELDKPGIYRSDSFVRQMAIHPKQSNGVYTRVKRRHLLRADADDIDLTPETYRLEIPYCNDQEIDNISTSTSSSARDPDVSYSDGNNKNSNWICLETHRRIPIHEYKGGKSNRQPSIRVGRHRCNNTKTCGLCVHKINVADPMRATGPYVLFDRSQSSMFDLETNRFSPVEQAAYGSRTKTTSNSDSSHTPRVMCCPPTPFPQSYIHIAKAVSLRKIFRQNELREKEANELLDDIKELNQVNRKIAAKI